MTKLLKSSFAIAAILACLWGCASTPEEPVFLVAAETGPEGYTIKDGAWSFETKQIRASGKPLRPEELADEPDVIGILAAKNYIVVRMEIENISPSKLIFNPAYVTLMTDADDYKKTLDYTDIYTILAGGEQEGGTNPTLKQPIYDLTLTLGPGDKVSRLLIFSPVDVDAESASLMINNIYVGKSDISITVPLLKYEKPEVKAQNEQTQKTQKKSRWKRL